MGGEKRGAASSLTEDRFLPFSIPSDCCIRDLRFEDPGISRFVILRVRWRRGVK